MVLQVFADARLVENDRDSELLKLGGRAYARDQQRLGRPDGAGRQDHLTLAARDLELAVLSIAHADRALAIENNLVGQAAGLEPEVCALEHRLEKPARRRPSQAALL